MGNLLDWRKGYGIMRALSIKVLGSEEFT